MSIFDKQLTSTSSTKKLDDFVREEASAERKIQLRNKITSNQTAKIKLTKDKTDETLHNAHLDNISKETPIERRLIYRAPDTWNFFGKPDDESYTLLVTSIAREGLMSPIILWEHENPENPEQKYMILSGHTREHAYDDLYQITGDDKYLAIPAKIYRANDINENDARRIIILANVAQRAKESIKVRVKSIGEYTRLTRERASYGSGDVVDKVAKHFKSSRATTYFYVRLQNLIQPLLERFCNGLMTRADATVLSGLSSNLQQYIVDNNYLKEMNRWQIQALKNARTTEDIDKIAIEGVPTEAKTHSYTIQLPVTKTKTSKVIGFCIDNKDSKIILGTIKKALANLELSRETKELLKQQNLIQ